MVGAGISGLAAAGVLSDYFERVTILERDWLPTTPMSRQGVPQSNHLHFLLNGGLNALASLFPGIKNDFKAAGAVPVNINLDFREEHAGLGALPQRDFGYEIMGMTRPLLELTLRNRVRQLPNVIIREQVRAREFVRGNDGGIEAISLKNADGGHEIIAADLLLDATGRGTLTQAAFEMLGLPAVEESRVGIDFRYATVHFQTPSTERDWKIVASFPDTPVGRKIAYMMPLENGRSGAIIGQMHSEEDLPGDWESFKAVVGQLQSPTIAEALAGATEVGKVHHFALTDSIRRHYERVSQMPRGILPIGDAISRVNPVYAQGMTVAAREACLLRDILQSRVGLKDPLAGLANEFVAAIEPMISVAWNMAATTDFAHPKTRGERPDGLEQALALQGALVKLAARDPEVHRTMIGVRQMIKPLSDLKSPELMARIQSELMG